MNTTPKTLTEAINDGDTITFRVHCDTTITEWSESGTMHLEWNGQNDIVAHIDLATEAGLRNGVLDRSLYTYGVPVRDVTKRIACTIPFDHVGGWEGWRPANREVRLISKKTVAKKAVRAAIQAWFDKGRINTTDVKFIIKF